MNKTSTRCKRTRIFTRTAIALAVASVLTAAPAVQAKNPFIPDFSLEDATVGQTVTGDSGSSAQGNAAGTKGAVLHFADRKKSNGRLLPTTDRQIHRRKTMRPRTSSFSVGRLWRKSKHKSMVCVRLSVPLGVLAVIASAVKIISG